MSALQDRLIALMNRVVAQPGQLVPSDADVELSQLGFDSMALVSLFVALESEFELSVQQLSRCLHKRCTLRALVALCSDSPA
jgi:acyl carrier protein